MPPLEPRPDRRLGTETVGGLVELGEHVVQSGRRSCSATLLLEARSAIVGRNCQVSRERVCRLGRLAFTQQGFG